MDSGFYEQIINLALAQALRNLGENSERISVKEPIDTDEARTILANYLREVAEQGLQIIREKSREDNSLQRQIEVCNGFIQQLATLTNEPSLQAWQIEQPAQRLLAIGPRRTDLTPQQNREMIHSMRPETSLSISTLFTGSVKEPAMVHELKREIQTADRIDMLISFIKWSGLRLIWDDLKAFTETRQLRVITTSYTGVTEMKAIMELAKLPNTEVKISYDTQTTRMHAKSYIFHRNTGFSTAYIGSSNLSRAAIGNGLEWNVKATQKDLPHILQHVWATFETYWHNPDFMTFNSTEEDQNRLAEALNMESRYEKREDRPFFFRIEPYPFQKEILEKLEAERQIQGRFRNLVVSATGTGKTVIAAFDYKRFCAQHPGQINRLLFIAHREEILDQSLHTFRTILRNANFGEMYVGNHHPTRFDHLFMSIQTFHSCAFHLMTSPDYYDFIIVDESHHAGALSYDLPLTYYQPKILLGLTATPERMDGISIQDRYFDGVIAAEIRLAEAINRQLLVPFQYFGITDEINLSTVRFERGRYDIQSLEKVYTGDHKRVDMIIAAIEKYSTNMNEIIGLGFCVSVAHAQFMARCFNERGIPAIALHGETLREERQTAQHRLINREVRFIFTVDLYNEGIDIPEVNTVLFLRPTESMTVFLQQLGRGLRIIDNKDVLTVFDFIGQANKHYSFEWKFRAMIGPSRHSVQHDLIHDFPTLPRNSFIQLERVAKEAVLENIRNHIVNKGYILSRLRTFANDTRMPLTLVNFLKMHDTIRLTDIYKRGTLQSLYKEANGNEAAPSAVQLDQNEGARKALLRLTHLNSRRMIDFLIEALRNRLPAELSAEQQRMLAMFHYTYWQKKPQDLGLTNFIDSFKHVHQNREVRKELIDLLQLLREQIHFIDEPVDLGFPCPLDLHCTYSIDEVLAAFDYWHETNYHSFQSGVLQLRDKKVDVFFITLNKSERDFSQTTMYEDYAIDETFFHWQSQSTTSIGSPTGQRYIHHAETGNKILLFVREYKKDEGITSAYTYLGKADFVSATGSQPISIVWRLQKPIPAEIAGKAIQAGVG